MGLNFTRKDLQQLRTKLRSHKGLCCCAYARHSKNVISVTGFNDVWCQAWRDNKFSTSLNTSYSSFESQTVQLLLKHLDPHVLLEDFYSMYCFGHSHGDFNDLYSPPRIELHNFNPSSRTLALTAAISFVEKIYLTTSSNFLIPPSFGDIYFVYGINRAFR